MQTAGPDGLTPTSAEARRRTIVPIYNAGSFGEQALFDLWSTKTPERT